MTDIHTPDERIAVADLERDGRRDARAGRCRSASLSRRGPVTAIVERHEGLVRLEVDGDRLRRVSRG